MSTEMHAVTGAFGFTGKYTARLLLDGGHRVRTLMGHPGCAGFQYLRCPAAAGMPRSWGGNMGGELFICRSRSAC